MSSANREQLPKTSELTAPPKLEAAIEGSIANQQQDVPANNADEPEKTESTPHSKFPTPPEELGEGDLILQRSHMSHLEGRVDSIHASLPELQMYMGWAVNKYSREDIISYMGIAWKEWESGARRDYAVLVDGKVEGSMGLMPRIGPGGLEIGYWVATRITGRGVATRGVQMLMNAAWTIGATHVQIWHSKANERSAAIPRRLGFRCLGECPKRKEIGWQFDREVAQSGGSDVVDGK